MTAAEECRLQLKKLKGRIQDYQAQVKQAASAQERMELKAKITAYRAAVRDVQVQLDYLEPPAQRKARRAQKKVLNVGAMPWDFFERSGAVWSDLEGQSWQQVEAGDFVELGATMEQLNRWMAEGAQRLTQRQRCYLDAYYNEGLSMEMIAQRYGVDASTVSKGVRRALANMRAWVDSKKLIQACADGAGGFDWARYLSQVPVLTARQRQLMLLVLSRLPQSQEDLADKLELDKSTVSRTLALAGRTIRRLNAGGKPISRPVIQNWAQADKYSLSLQTGMPLWFYYRYCFKGQKIGGVTRYQYELARRLETGASAEDVAQELGLTVKTVRSARWRLKRSGVRIGHLRPPEGDCIGARLDAQTYVKLQRMVTARAAP